MGMEPKCKDQKNISAFFYILFKGQNTSFRP